MGMMRILCQSWKKDGGRENNKTTETERII